MLPLRVDVSDNNKRRSERDCSLKVAGEKTVKTKLSSETTAHFSFETNKKGKKEKVE
jgi:hypothetical protein